MKTLLLGTLLFASTVSPLDISFKGLDNIKLLLSRPCESTYRTGKLILIRDDLEQLQRVSDKFGSGSQQEQTIVSQLDVDFSIMKQNIINTCSENK